MDKKYIDLSTFIGIFLTIIIVITAISFSGNLYSFFDFSSFLIVIGGTFFITTACFSIKDVIEAHKGLAEMLFTKSEDPSKAAINALQLAEIAKKHGLINLAEQATKISGNSFISKGIELITDNNHEIAEKILSQEIKAAADKQSKVINILRKSAEISPAMGLIGTLIGLVQMLSNLSDISKIGPAMAVALLTTFYGALLSYVVFFPLASKLERNAKEEYLTASIYLKALISIAKKENPRYLEIIINSLLSPTNKISYFK